MKQTWKNILLSVFIIMITVAAITASAQAAFTAAATVSGINFSTGNAALKLFGNLAYTNAGNNGNLTTTLGGVGFTGIGPFWTSDYVLKYFNTGSVNLKTSLRDVVHTDPAGLASHITVETWLWNDNDHDGHAGGTDTYTLLGAAQTLTNLQSNPVDLGQLNAGNPRGVLLRFTADDLPSNMQNQQLLVDFIIDGTTTGATP